MFKKSDLVILLVTFSVFALAGTANAQTTRSPTIVASGRVLNQPGPIAQTPIFTPTHTGLYRLSVYATVVNPCHGGSCTTWALWFYWTDDAGAELDNGYTLSWYGGQPGYGRNFGSFPGGVVPFEAVAGNPVSFSVSGTPDGSSYSLYYTIELLK